MPTLTDKQTNFLKRHFGYNPPKKPTAKTKPREAWGSSPVSPEENDRLDALTPQALVQTNLVQTDLDQVFEEDYMSALKDVELKGEGDPKLANLMREIEKGLFGPRRVEVMAALARIVGVPPTAEALDIDYGRFLIVQKQQKVNGIEKKKSPPDLDEDKHPEFRASRGQLLFGKVLGDAFGIHEVFASLLSPTGGLVGPGNWLIPGVVEAGHLDPDNPVALHGSVHDAAGYLLTYHDEGPGYNYLDSDLELLGTGSPLSGQISGILYWTAEAGDEYILRRVDAVVAKVEKGLKTVRKEVASKIDGLLSVFRKKKDKAVETVDALADEVMDVASAMEDALSRVKTTVVEPPDPDDPSGTAALPDAVKGKLSSAKRFVWS